MTRRAFVAALVPLAGLHQSVTGRSYRLEDYGVQITAPVPNSGVSVTEGVDTYPAVQKFYIHGPLLPAHNGCTTPALIKYGVDKLDALRAAGLQIDDVLEYRDGGEATAAACQKRITK